MEPDEDDSSIPPALSLDELKKRAEYLAFLEDARVAEFQALDRFPALGETMDFGSPFSRLLKPAAEPFALRLPAPSATDALDQPGVFNVLRRILDDAMQKNEDIP
jgi:hypothetical protein